MEEEEEEEEEELSEDLLAVLVLEPVSVFASVAVPVPVAEAVSAAVAASPVVAASAAVVSTGFSLHACITQRDRTYLPGPLALLRTKPSRCPKKARCKAR